MYIVKSRVKQNFTQSIRVSFRTLEKNHATFTLFSTNYLYKFALENLFRLSALPSNRPPPKNKVEEEVIFVTL